MKQISLQAADGIRLAAVLHEPAGRLAGAVVQLHGITGDMDEEGGKYVRLAGGLAWAGLAVLRFDFRGHGRSGGTDHGMTIAGEMLDLQAALDYIGKHLPATSSGAQLPLSIVATSFGAVPTLLSLSLMRRPLHSLVLWNPVLDLVRTFVHPELPWGQANFGGQASLLTSRGYVVVNDRFRLGRVAYTEMRHYGRTPYDYFISSKMPALVVHGDHDAAVSYDIAKAAVADRRIVGTQTDLHTVEGSDHRFEGHEDEAIQVTLDWLTRQHAR